ncbi:MAG: hypothetical protein NTW49_02825 [Bacteroidia bacterium]|nr:hypothetical protein [Bacteroidia bacterium]
MKKLFKWDFATKVSIIFGIIGGLYLFYQIFAYFFSDKLKFNSDISIIKFNLPIEKYRAVYREDIEKIVPQSIDPFFLSYNIADSLLIFKPLSHINKSILADNIINAIPRQIDHNILVHSIDSLILDKTYPVRLTRYYVESSIENKCDHIVKELRFEIPANGYYELYDNDNFIKNGNFQDFISLDEIRPSNTISLKIWSFDFVSELDLKYYKKIKYTFNNGFIVPTVLKSIPAKGILFWIQENPFGSIFIFILILDLVYILYGVRNYYKFMNDSKDNNVEAINETNNKKT